MLDRILPDMALRGVAFGSHETRWDMRIYLYRGGTSMRIDRALEAIDEGKLGGLEEERLPLVNVIHAVLQAKVASGGRKGSLAVAIHALKAFFAWAELNAQPLTLEDAAMTFTAWTEHLIHRYRVVKEIKHVTAYHQACTIAGLLARALGGHSPVWQPGASLLALTRMKSSKTRKSVSSTRADKQNLEQTFVFGHLLADICDGLDLVTLRGPIPVTLTLRDGRALFLKCELKARRRAPKKFPDKSHREEAARIRAALGPGKSTITPRRRPLLNLRIDAELLIFIAQTGMNLAQAFSLRREDYRWRTVGDEVEVFRVYKNRRGGEAVFWAFKQYRQHLQRYLEWLEKTGLAGNDDRLFPYEERSHRIVKAADTLPAFSATHTVCKDLGIRYIGARELRKTRVNWLLRRSRDPDLTAEMGAHAKETLIRDYERPHHQAAVNEVTRFHLTNDPTFQPPGPGLCVENGRQPKPVPDCPSQAPQPDCANPDGCLFCVHHRDEMSLDYCWRLASARYLKALEVALWRSPEKEPIHPANRVIDRINAKMQAISELGQMQDGWIREAEDRMREGTFHPMLSALIELGETLT